jgi:2-polyprenyl-3-methyl-5-hydroxy-6-metoxy-1,4-benzoquinol methylase
MKLVERANAGLHAHVMQLMSELVPDRTSPILDVGCGTGAFLVRLQAAGYRSLAGVDIKTPAAGLAGINFSEFDLDTGTMPFADASFRVVTSIEVFEHVENLGALVSEIARVLAPDGVFIMTTPNIHSIEARLRFLLLGKLKQFDDLSDPTHISPIVLHTFARLLKRHSLEIATVGSFPVDGSSPTSRGMLRAMARVLKMLGLRANPDGDHLSLLIRHRVSSASHSNAEKRELVTAHY